MPARSTDEGAFDRITVERIAPTHPSQFTRRIRIKDTGALPRGRQLDLTRDELIALYDHLSREVLGL